MRRGAIAALMAAVAVLAGGWRAASSAEAPVADQRRQLIEARAQSAAAAARSARFERDAANERDKAARARASEAAIAARIQQAEADMAAGRARIAIAERLIDAQRDRLAGRQGPVVRLVAALQSLARRPALIGVVQPGTVDDLVHVRAVLATALPVIHARTADVRADLARARRLRAGAALAAQALADGRARLEGERLSLARLEAEHRSRSRALGRDALVESDRAIALGERARDLVALMDRLGDQAATRTALEALPGPLPRPPRPGEVASAIGTLSWSHGTPPYRLPVAGRVVTGLGELSDAGVRSRGITLVGAPGARAVAPAAGRVAYAGRFRDYGVVVILDHGGGWTSLVSGLGSASVRVGDLVAQGGPIGQVPDGEDPRVTVELRRRDRAVDMTPLLG